MKVPIHLILIKYSKNNKIKFYINQQININQQPKYFGKTQIHIKI